MCIVLFVSLGGCFLSDSPAISDATAENVGARLQYTEYNPYAQPQDERTFIRFKRWKGKQYRLTLANEVGSQETDAYKGWLIRRFGTRNGEPIFLIQYQEPNERRRDAPLHGYDATVLIYPVVVTPGGVGIVGAVDCKDKRVKRVARSHGIKISCTDAGDEPFKFPRIVNKASEKQIWSFLVELLSRNLFKWEDTHRFSAFGWQF
ncbi:hypothetical protein RXV86_12555 [Alisedimentitalea sp. MJ-SS2]|uniref:hypothetical protein n=1 Tax=Aliisedimentitalea sp. MJ-SS2 TaxID=3049795 RepID=UPI00290DD88C|nr:hypothetical protein [Alisedimentitalea sp. MJ-SS2]MDU8928220.1 hypothetical protein [Alisedimentitalea sp. MJ-SS2]